VTIALGIKGTYIKFGRCPPKRNNVIVNVSIIVKVVTCPSFLEDLGVLSKELVFLISKRALEEKKALYM